MAESVTHNRSITTIRRHNNRPVTSTTAVRAERAAIGVLAGLKSPHENVLPNLTGRGRATGGHGGLPAQRSPAEP